MQIPVVCGFWCRFRWRFRCWFRCWFWCRFRWRFRCWFRCGFRCWFRCGFWCGFRCVLVRVLVLVWVPVWVPVLVQVGSSVGSGVGFGVGSGVGSSVGSGVGSGAFRRFRCGPSCGLRYGSPWNLILLCGCRHSFLPSLLLWYCLGLLRAYFLDGYIIFLNGSPGLSRGILDPLLVPMLCHTSRDPQRHSLPRHSHWWSEDAAVFLGWLLPWAPNIRCRWLNQWTRKMLNQCQEAAYNLQLDM